MSNNNPKIFYSNYSGYLERKTRNQYFKSIGISDCSNNFRCSKNKIVYSNNYDFYYKFKFYNQENQNNKIKGNKLPINYKTEFSN